MKHRRSPQRTPGKAIMGESNTPDDFALPAALFSDAVHFMSVARQYADDGIFQGETTYLRAALHAVFSSLEAKLNQTAFGHAEAHAETLGSIERDVLQEQETVLDDRGLIVRKPRYYPLEARISFLAMFLSGQELDRNTDTWRRFLAAKQLRDTWTHPKPPFDTWSLTFEAVLDAMFAVRDVMMENSRLMGIEPVQWLIDLSKALEDLPRQADG